jgi:hypothetical protein
MNELISKQNIIVYQAQGEETIGEVITEIFPDIENEAQLLALYHSIVIMNRHSGFLGAEQNETVNLEKVLLKNSCIIFPSYDSLIYKNIFEVEIIDTNLVNSIAEENNNQYAFIETNETLKENLSQSMSDIGLVNMIAAAETMHEISSLFNPSYNDKIEALVQVAKCTPDNPTGLPNSLNDLSKKLISEGNKESVGDGLIKAFKDDWMKEYGKEGVKGIASTLGIIELRVRELDHLLIQYAHAKGIAERQRLKLRIKATKNVLNKIVPSVFQKSVENVLKRTAKKNIKKNPKKAAMSKAYLNPNRALKAADKAKSTTQKLNALLELHASQVQSEKAAGFFERYYGKNKKSTETWKKIIDKKLTGSLILRNAEYKKYLGYMAKTPNLAIKGGYVLDIFIAFYNVYDAYRKEQNWKKLAVGEGSSLVSGFLAAKACESAARPLFIKLPSYSKLLVPISCVAFGIASGFIGKFSSIKAYEKISKEVQEFMIENGFVHANP